MIQVVSIPPCNANPFAGRGGAGGGAGAGEGGGEGRKRHRQRKIKIPCRGGGGAGGAPAAISRYLMEFDQLETIGAGRFSLVYKVRKRLDGWVYAVKRSRHSLETEGEREAAMREVFALAALQGCPQLVRYLGAWMEERHLYIQTEFCPGGSLERAVFPRHGQQQQQGEAAAGEGGGPGGFDGSEEALLRVARDVASALQFMHARGIVHMDVKVRAFRGLEFCYLARWTIHRMHACSQLTHHHPSHSTAGQHPAGGRRLLQAGGPGTRHPRGRVHVGGGGRRAVPLHGGPQGP